MAHDRERRKGKGAAADRRRVPKKKTSILTSERVVWIDYKDVNLLRRFMSERAKIRARRVTGNSQQQQVAVARAIRIAREMALLPYSVRQVTQRSKGGRRDGGDRGDRGDRGELRAPVELPLDAPELDEVAFAGVDDGELDAGVLDGGVLDSNGAASDDSGDELVGSDSSASNGDSEDDA
jgi:small subunit ribosomal protein S18